MKRLIICLTLVVMAYFAPPVIANAQEIERASCPQDGSFSITTTSGRTQPQVGNGLLYTSSTFFLNKITIKAQRSTTPTPDFGIYMQVRDTSNNILATSTTIQPNDIPTTFTETSFIFPNPAQIVFNNRYFFSAKTEGNLGGGQNIILGRTTNANATPCTNLSNELAGNDLFATKLIEEIQEPTTSSIDLISPQNGQTITTNNVSTTASYLNRTGSSNNMSIVFRFNEQLSPFRTYDYQFFGTINNSPVSTTASSVSQVPNGTYFVRALLRKNGVSIATSETASTTITGDPSVVGTPVFGTPSTTSSTAELTAQCDPNSGFFANSICNIFIFLFYPDTLAVSQFSQITLDDKFPFSYFFDLKDTIQGAIIDNAQNYPLLVINTDYLGSIVLFSSSSLIGLIGNNNFNLISNMLIAGIWLLFGVYLYDRARDII